LIENRGGVVEVGDKERAAILELSISEVALTFQPAATRRAAIRRYLDAPSLLKQEIYRMADLYMHVHRIVCAQGTPSLIAWGSRLQGAAGVHVRLPHFHAQAPLEPFINLASGSPSLLSSDCGHGLSGGTATMGGLPFPDCFAICDPPFRLRNSTRHLVFYGY
jgi:hypothetical protein